MGLGILACNACNRNASLYRRNNRAYALNIRRSERLGLVRRPENQHVSVYTGEPSSARATDEAAQTDTRGQLSALLTTSAVSFDKPRTAAICSSAVFIRAWRFGSNRFQRSKLRAMRAAICGLIGSSARICSIMKLYPEPSAAWKLTWLPPKLPMSA